MYGEILPKERRNGGGEWEQKEGPVRFGKRTGPFAVPYIRYVV